MNFCVISAAQHSWQHSLLFAEMRQCHGIARHNSKLKSSSLVRTLGSSARFCNFPSGSAMTKRRVDTRHKHTAILPVLQWACSKGSAMLLLELLSQMKRSLSKQQRYVVTPRFLRMALLAHVHLHDFLYIQQSVVCSSAADCRERKANFFLHEHTNAGFEGDCQVDLSLQGPPVRRRNTYPHHRCTAGSVGCCTCTVRRCHQ
jgi:hypothetical protein